MVCYTYQLVNYIGQLLLGSFAQQNKDEVDSYNSVQHG